MKKRWIPVFIAAGMLAGSIAVGAQEEETVTFTDPGALLKYEMTSVGSLTEDSYFYFMRDALLKEDGEHYAMLSAGGDVVAEGLDNVEYLGSGLYTVRQPLEEDNVNKTGLVTMEGDVLIPCEAASVVKPANRDMEGLRFLEVIYTTEETDSEDECIIYFTQDMFSLSVGEDDVMYKGYAKIFDAQEKCFVEGIELDQSDRYGFYDLGDAFAITHGNTTTMYDAGGNQIWESEGLIMGNTYHALVVSVDGNYYIVDGTGSDVFKTEESLSECVKAADYFTAYGGGDNPYHIIDMQGNPVLSDTFSIVYDSSPDAFAVKTADSDALKVLTADGTVIAENASYSFPVIGGYGYVSFDDSEAVTVYTPNGFYPDLQAESSSNLVFGKDDSAVILNTGEKLSFSGDAEGSAAGLGLLAVSEESSAGKFTGLYDMFTGDELLATEYTRIEKAGEYILACKTDSSGVNVWEVYHTELVPAE